MKNLLWLLLGAAVGFIAAKRLGRTAGGGQLLGSLDERAREFGRTVAAAYRARESELRAAIGGADSPRP